MESSMLEMLKDGTRKRVEERLSYDAKEKNEQIQHHISLEDEVIEMKNEIIELKEKVGAFDKFKLVQKEYKEFLKSIPQTISEDSLIEMLSEIAFKFSPHYLL